MQVQPVARSHRPYLNKAEVGAILHDKSRLEYGSGRLLSSLRAVIGFPACTAPLT